MTSLDHPHPAAAQSNGSRISASAFVVELDAALDRLVESQHQAVLAAADLVGRAIRTGGIVQAFGTGHSESLATEIAGRAGGLVPTNKIALRDLVIFGRADVSVLFDPYLERDPAVAARLYELADPDPADVFVVASSSGANGCVVEFARLVKERSHDLIAVTSLEHSRRAPSRHPSGRRIADFADIVLDNGAPVGDAVLPLRSGGAACGISSITGSVLVQLLLAEVVRRMEDAGEEPPIYLSSNVEGGDDHNNRLEARYAGRIRRTA